MRRQVYLESAAATKNGTRYSFDFRSRMERDFTGFQLRDAIAVHDNQETRAADTESISDLSPHIWLNWADTSKISPANIEVGDSISSIVSKGEAGITIAGSTNYGLNYRKIGEAFCVKSETNWHAMGDTSTPNPAVSKDEGSIWLMFRSPDPMTNTIIWSDRVFRFWPTSGVIKLLGKESGGNVFYTTTLNIQPGTDYLLEASYNRSNNKQMDLILTDLANDTEQTFTENFANHTTSSGDETGHHVLISTAQYGFLGWSVGEVVRFNEILSPLGGITVTNYMKALYAGGTVGSALPVHSLTLHSDFLSQARHGKSIGKDTGLQLLKYDNAFTLDGALYHKDRSEKYECDNDRLDIIDLYFTKPDGTEVECEFSVCVDLFNDASQL